MRSLKERIETELRGAIAATYGVELEELVSESPPRSSLGDLAFPVAFELARSARTAPRKIAETLRDAVASTPGVDRIEVAGAGYLNVFFDRERFLADFLGPRPAPAPELTTRKTIVEHTNINPNKAAHIGHLRNAALGDTFVRVLQRLGERVEIQNYIDDTGVQVADVVVGLLHIEKKTLEEVREIASRGKFDHYCWDLYARVSDFYAEDGERLRLRERTSKEIEEREAPVAPMASFVAETIVHCHLDTMERIGVRYDVLPRESDILKLRFWERAFELLKDRGAIRLAETGKNAGCWVMDLGDENEKDGEPADGDEVRATVPTEDDGGDEKVIVRSNGTVTYVGKDIAYQMWKLGLLDREFGYRVFHAYPDGQKVWSTCEPARSDAPDFGHGGRVYNVIDARQAYLQRIVQRGVALLATEEARERSRHFSYEMVALTPATCRELGLAVSAEDEKKPYIEVSGRKGLGVKADDLLDELEKKARLEVDRRNRDLPEAERGEIARAIARGALRYFMIKYTKNKVIAFDFGEALSFEGDSGPYLQYAAVRAGKILERMRVSTRETRESTIELPASTNELLEALPAEEADDLWGLVREAAALDEVAAVVARTEEPAHLARFARELAQRFNAFYHLYRIAQEEDERKRALRLLAVRVFYRQQAAALDLMGIPVPERM